MDNCLLTIMILMLLLLFFILCKNKNMFANNSTFIMGSGHGLCLKGQDTAVVLDACTPDDNGNKWQVIPVINNEKGVISFVLQNTDSQKCLSYDPQQPITTYLNENCRDNRALWLWDSSHDDNSMRVRLKHMSGDNLCFSVKKGSPSPFVGGCNDDGNWYPTIINPSI